MVSGDGRRIGAEGCDDGNTASFDGCSPQCTVMRGWRCDGGSTLRQDVCVEYHGDGIRTAGEQCDDGNELHGDGCLCNAEGCWEEDGWRCVTISLSHYLRVSVTVFLTMRLKLLSLSLSLSLVSHALPVSLSVIVSITVSITACLTVSTLCGVYLARNLIPQT